MNAEQKQRAAELISRWNKDYPEFVGDRMANLLQELIDTPEVLAATNPAQISSSAEPVLVVETEPGYWNRGHYYEGTKAYIDPTKVWGLPVGTKLYTAPSELSADVARDAERYRWLRDKCRATSEHWGGRWSLVIEGPCPDGDESFGAIDKAIDAARERQGGA